MGSPEQRVIHSSIDPNWRTPQPLFDRLHQEFHFEIDLAADQASCKVETPAGLFYFGPDHPEEYSRNALTIGWADLMPGGVGFLNMPYSKKLLSVTGDDSYDVSSWIGKAYGESVRGFRTVAIVPYSPQTDWYRRFVMGHKLEGGVWGWGGHAALEVRRLPYRVDFDPSPEYVEWARAEFEAGRRKTPESSSAGHNVVVVEWGPNPGYVGPWVPTERYWSYK